MSELDCEQLRHWFAETGSDNVSVLGVSDGDEINYFVEEVPDTESDKNSSEESE